MTDNFKMGILGDTGLEVSRLGLGASYGAPAEAFEEAFEKGCNYFYLGSGRREAGMKTAVRNLQKKNQREKMVIAVQTYLRVGMMTEFFFERALKSIGIEYADILILGWHNSIPFSSLMDVALKMKTKGLCRFIGISGHNRALFPELAEKKIFDIFQIRYNPAHRGAETECFPVLKDFRPRPGIVSYTATRWGQLLNQKHMPPGETALTATGCYRFVLSNLHVDVCLCGPKNRDEMRQALAALDSGPLDAAETERIKAIGDHVHKTVKSFFA